jgi:hypothetical protein
VTATVTNMKQYRIRKNGAKNINYFSDWSDKRLTTRHKLLEYVEAGHTDLIDDTQDMVKLTFPGGFNPDKNPGDNIAAVYAECVRRGVFVASE